MTITTEDRTTEPEWYIARLEEQVRKLKAEVDELEHENGDLEVELHNLSQNIAMLEGESLEHVRKLAEELVVSDWFSAVVVQVSQQRWGAQVVLDVDMTPGDAVYVTPGTRLTLSHASAEDFAAVRAEV